MLTSVGWGSLDVHRFLVLAADLAAATFTRAATVATCADAAVAVAILLRVRLAGPSVGAGVGVRLRTHNHIIALSLVVVIFQSDQITHRTP